MACVQSPVWNVRKRIVTDEIRYVDAQEVDVLSIKRQDPVVNV